MYRRHQGNADENQNVTIVDLKTLHLTMDVKPLKKKSFAEALKGKNSKQKMTHRQQKASKKQCSETSTRCYASHFCDNLQSDMKSIDDLFASHFCNKLSIWPEKLLLPGPRDSKKNWIRRQRFRCLENFSKWYSTDLVLSIREHQMARLRRRKIICVYCPDWLSGRIAFLSLILCSGDT